MGIAPFVLCCIALPSGSRLIRVIYIYVHMYIYAHKYIRTSALRRLLRDNSVVYVYAITHALWLIARTNDIDRREHGACVM